MQTCMNNNKVTKIHTQGINHAQWTYPVPVITPHLHPLSTPRHLSLLHIRWRECLNHTGTIHKPCSENPVRIRKHAVLQTDDDELTAAETCADQATDVLGV